MDTQDSRADGIIRRMGQLAGARTNYEASWREIARRILPRSDLFAHSRAPGTKVGEYEYDATPSLALDRYAAAKESMITPRTMRWHGLRPMDDRLDDDPETKQWCEQTTKILFEARYAPRANFASQANEVYLSEGAFGTGVVFVDDNWRAGGLRYRSCHLSEVYLAENFQGIVDTVYRKNDWTLRQIVQRFGEDALTDDLKRALEKEPDRAVKVIHALAPSEDLDIAYKGRRRWPIASCYVLEEGRKVLDEGGFSLMPYAIDRGTLSPRETYGRSPAMTVLADVNTLNEMGKTTLRAAHNAVDPALLLQEDGALQAFDLRPGALNFGGVDDQGRPLVHALQRGERVDIGLEMMDQRRRVINDAFLVTLFQILVETPQMTATEAMLRAQEKGALLAPTMGRSQSEFLGPLIRRELDILARAGALPPMPRQMMMAGGMRVEYVSPLNRAQRADEGVAMMRTLEAVAPLAQIDPSVMAVFKVEEFARELAEINGVPQKVLNTPEEVQAIMAAQKQAMNAQQLLAAAPVASGVVKDLAQAQNMASQPIPAIAGGGP